MRNRSIDVQSFLRDPLLFMLRHVFHGPHIVQSVG